MKRVVRITLLAVLGLLLFKPASAQVAVGIRVSFGPPAIPVYDQPPCPEDGWMWTPGYWAWDADDNDYYWVPGTWVAAPEPGFLWTPGWWGWDNDAFLWHEGFWGPTIGFYGGIDYGFGYFGTGFYGGRWQGGRFFYNTAVWQVNTTVVRNVYVDRAVVRNERENRVSYNGGQGGVEARPTAQEEAAERERHIPPSSEQTQHRDQARSNPELRASANQGRPPIAATAKPGDFKGSGVVRAKSAGAPYHPPANRAQGENARPGNENARPENERPEAEHPANEGAKPGENNATPTHARDLQPHQAPALPEGASAADRKAQEQQAKLAAKQNQEHEKLAKQQEKEDQQAQKYSAEKRQQVEQKHQQQTQKMEQRHAQEQQRVARPRPAPAPKPKEPR